MHARRRFSQSRLIVCDVGRVAVRIGPLARHLFVLANVRRYRLRVVMRLNYTHCSAFGAIAQTRC